MSYGQVWVHINLSILSITLRTLSVVLKYYVLIYLTFKNINWLNINEKQILKRLYFLCCDKSEYFFSSVYNRWVLVQPFFMCCCPGLVALVLRMFFSLFQSGSASTVMLLSAKPFWIVWTSYPYPRCFQSRWISSPLLCPYDLAPGHLSG